MVTLAELASELDGADVRGDGSVAVTGATHDSREVAPGDLFVCVPGARVDGHRHATAAVAAGAVALLCERALGLGVPEMIVPSARAAMGRAAAAVHGHPSSALEVAGITGTNGKTTTAHFLGAILRAAGRSVEVMGTLSGPRTTPEATDLQAVLARHRDAGVTSVVMEVSSHALALGRVTGTRFAVAVFTNLGRDHLDFHETQEAYFTAKARLFEPDLTAAAVVNADDLHGRLLLDAARVPTTPFGLADLDDLEVGLLSSTARWWGVPLRVPLGGVHNVRNALAALTAATVLGVDSSVAAEALAGAGGVAGRMEPVVAGQPFEVLVDFAHTPDGLEQVLRAARTGVGSSGRVLVVFGAGGEKDADKRPLMGEAAARHADVVVITSDNPRGESPSAIIEAVVAGTRDGTTVRVEPDRRTAIALALAEARPGDVVVIAGKGHETEQVVGDLRLPFDDRLVVRELLGEAPA